MLRRFNMDRAARALITTPVTMPLTQVLFVAVLFITYFHAQT